MSSVSIEQEFRDFLARRHEATTAFFNGDAGPWKAQAMHTDAITMFGGYGGSEQGWAAVSERYTWAAARNAEGAIQPELIAWHVTPEMAYTVAIERGEVRSSGGQEFAPKALRVTEIFRREGADWKLVHRHADPLVAVRQ
ncbi:MAG: nuclear transport factor 2 family protein [Chloroflexota bacterium]|nr:nuclear transport factor 2 family protein [Chloroflexota bacterium]